MSPAAAQPQPPYLRIVAEIRDRIGSGRLAVGERVPSARQITQEWGVAIATATRALATLRQEGLVRAVPGVGTVVEAVPAASAASVGSAASAAPGVAPPVPGAGRRREPRQARGGRDLLERMDPREGPGAEPDLTRDRIVRTGIAIADQEGLPAVSMRRVAGELGVATMSLYRYVDGKDELIFQMADAVFGELDLPVEESRAGAAVARAADAPAGWRARLEHATRLQWALYRRHPWMARLVSLTRPMLAPNGMAHTDWSMRAVDGLGFDITTMLYIAVTLAGYVHGMAVNLEYEMEARDATGVTGDEWTEAQDSAFAAIIASGRFPMLARVALVPDLDIDLDKVFELGLTFLLDGLDRLIRSHACTNDA